MFSLKLALIIHFPSARVVSAVASGERVGLSSVSSAQAAVTKIDEHSSQ